MFHTKTDVSFGNLVTFKEGRGRMIVADDILMFPKVRTMVRLPIICC